MVTTDRYSNEIRRYNRPANPDLALGNVVRSGVRCQPQGGKT
jgi:hypothetical protein